jgi:hypothetical protein
MVQFRRSGRYYMVSKTKKEIFIFLVGSLFNIGGSGVRRDNPSFRLLYCGVLKPNQNCIQKKENSGLCVSLADSNLVQPYLNRIMSHIYQYYIHTKLNVYHCNSRQSSSLNHTNSIIAHFLCLPRINNSLCPFVFPHFREIRARHFGVLFAQGITNNYGFCKCLF